MDYNYEMPKGDKKLVLKKLEKNLNDFSLYSLRFVILTKKGTGDLEFNIFCGQKTDKGNLDSCKMVSFYGQMHGQLVIISIVYDGNKISIDSKIPIDQVMSLSEQLGLVPCEDYGFYQGKTSVHAV